MSPTEPGGASTRSQSRARHSDTVKQTIVETIEAPRLLGVGTADLVDFAKKREIYERRVAQKNNDSNLQVPLTTYRDSIDKSVLQVLVLADWVPVSKVEDITEEHLQKCIEERAKVKPEDYDLTRIEEELKDVKLEQDYKSTLSTQVYNMILQYTIVLDKLGYNEFTEKHPKLSVKHLLSRVSHPHLRNRMLMFCETRKKEEFQENFKEFVKELIKEAEKIDYLNSAKRFKPALQSAADSPVLQGNSTTAGKSRRNPTRSGSKQRGNTTGPVQLQDEPSPAAPKAGNSSSSKRAREAELPVCLNKKCRKRHFIDDCELTPDEEKRELKKSYWEAKKARRTEHKKGAQTGGKPKEGTVGQVGASAPDENTSLFSAAFCNGAVEALVLADQGSDANLISSEILDSLHKADPQLCVTSLPIAQTFHNAGKGSAPIRCSRTLQANLQLRVRHGTNLVLRGVKWLVSDDPIEYVYIGRHVLSSLGMNNRVLLTAACDRLGGVVNIPEALKNDGHADDAVAQRADRAAIHSVLADRGYEYGSTFHSHGGSEDDRLEEADVYVDLGDDPEHELKAALERLVADARQNGISEEGASRLSSMLNRYKSVFAFGWEKPRQPTWNQ